MYSYHPYSSIYRTNCLSGKLERRLPETDEEQQLWNEEALRLSVETKHFTKKLGMSNEDFPLWTSIKGINCMAELFNILPEDLPDGYTEIESYLSELWIDGLYPEELPDGYCPDIEWYLRMTREEDIQKPVVKQMLKSELTEKPELTMFNLGKSHHIILGLNASDFFLYISERGIQCSPELCKILPPSLPRGFRDITRYLWSLRLPKLVWQR
jgi:hypothetical protein